MVLILPYWNVNQSVGKYRKTAYYQVLILPYWNVNEFMRQKRTSG